MEIKLFVAIGHNDAHLSVVETNGFEAERFYERIIMQKLRKATARGFQSLSRAIKQQPDYDSEISVEYLEALGKQIDESKPENFRLTPISDPGW